jgi:hypothetical protein
MIYQFLFQIIPVYTIAKLVGFKEYENNIFYY